MSLERIVSDYERFLRGYGVDERCSCSKRAPMANPSKVPQRVKEAYWSGNLRGLDDFDLVAFDEAVGAEYTVHFMYLPIHLVQLGAMLTALGDVKIGSAADLGGGPGLTSLFLASHPELSWDMTMLTAAQVDVDYCRRESARLGVQMKTICAYAQIAPLADGCVDLAFCFDLLDCTSAWQQVIMKMARIARKRVVIMYSVISNLRRIDPHDVADILSLSMTVEHFVFDPSGGSEPACALIIGRKD